MSKLKEYTIFEDVLNRVIKELNYAITKRRRN